MLPQTPHHSSRPFRNVMTAVGIVSRRCVIGTQVVLSQNKGQIIKCKISPLLQFKTNDIYLTFAKSCVAELMSWVRECCALLVKSPMATSMTGRVAWNDPPWIDKCQSTKLPGSNRMGWCLVDFRGPLFQYDKTVRKRKTDANCQMNEPQAWGIQLKLITILGTSL